MKLCVIGTGYIGLVGAAVFADWGNTVIGVDKVAEKIERIKAGDMPIYEPGLAEVVSKNITEGRLSFTTDLAEGIKDAEVVFICVGTPQDHDGSADLSYVFGVAEEIGKNLHSYKVIVTKSTVPVGTNEKVKEIIKKNLKSNIAFDVASNPEFLREGSSIEDMQKTDRTVVGTETEKARDIMRSLYAHLEAPMVECDLRSAELIKYAANSFLATKITFINEISQLCERVGADVKMVGYGMGLDRRIGNKFLHAGLGYGGSCFPKDVSALYKSSMDNAYNFRILRSVMHANELQRESFIKKITYELGEILEGKTFTCLGLTFKNNTDDVRESVAIKIVRALRGMGAKIKVYDPQGMENAKKVLGIEGISYCATMTEAVEDSDALAILTEWDEFRGVNLKKFAHKGKHVFDGRNMLEPALVRQEGLVYYGVGRI